MARITGEITISAPIEVVFDTAVDVRNEPDWNPGMREVELLTPGPIGPGTRFLARMGDSGMEMRVELTGFDRPHGYSVDTAMDMMETSGSVAFTETSPGGTTMAWSWEVRPIGWLRLVSPLMGPIGARAERRTWAGLKRLLEAAP